MLRILFVWLMVGARTLAQPAPSGSPEVFWQLTTSTVATPASSINEVVIRQAGTGNQAAIAVLGQQNQIGLIQATNTNVASVQLTGQGNQLQLNQAGAANRLAVGLDGSGNQLRVTQSGGDVVSLLGVSGNNARIDLIQRNGNNTIVADGLTVPGGTAAMGVANLKIEQSGGATVRIQNGPSTRQ